VRKLTTWAFHIGIVCLADAVTVQHHAALEHIEMLENEHGSDSDSHSHSSDDSDSDSDDKSGTDNK
jgi:hypothetical protein